MSHVPNLDNAAAAADCTAWAQLAAGLDHGAGNWVWPPPAASAPRRHSRRSHHSICHGLVDGTAATPAVLQLLPRPLLRRLV
jgi:hypothetical protein